MKNGIVFLFILAGRRNGWPIQSHNNPPWLLNEDVTVDDVKVWFQNRRTKHKRQKQEEEQNTRQSDHKSGTSTSSGESKHHQHPHSTGSHDYADKHTWQNGDDMPSSPISDDGSMVEIESAPDSPEMAPLST
ncbi:homeobox domain-containing protein [Caerostris extrusa]|uniref:Homeobox domain-containing protein n=1 Tax=Caerostris extrusa TaxID=172846 RepID=A0AAV4NDV2_CAEEX|nr:homeobox domain-containing protein [Caerostris extrusa]